MKLLILLSFFFLSCNAQKPSKSDSLKKEIIILQYENKKLLAELKAVNDSLQAYRKRDEDLRFWIQSLLNRE